MGFELKKKKNEKSKTVGTSVIKHSFVGRSVFNYFSTPSEKCFNYLRTSLCTFDGLLTTFFGHRLIKMASIDKLRSFSQNMMDTAIYATFWVSER